MLLYPSDEDAIVHLIKMNSSNSLTWKYKKTILYIVALWFFTRSKK